MTVRSEQSLDMLILLSHDSLPFINIFLININFFPLLIFFLRILDRVTIDMEIIPRAQCGLNLVCHFHILL